MPKFPKYIIANWKMNMSMEQVETWLHNFSKLETKLPSHLLLVIAPSLPYLLHVRAYSMEQANMGTAAQDISINNGGSFTGMVGAFQIKDFCQFCILNHSELKDNKKDVIRKRDLCLQSHITPIVCFTKIKDGIELYKEGVILAWEDPNTISVQGHYQAEDPGVIEKNIQEIKSKLPNDARVVYGGSVNRQNASKLANIIQLDGVLIGNASLDPHHLHDIVKAFEI